MSKHIKQFQNEAAYNEFRQSQDFILPNLSLCIEENTFKSEAAPPPHDYSKDYLTIISREDDNHFMYRYTQVSSTSVKKVIYVSLDNGQTWYRRTPDSGTSIYTVFNKGDKILLKGDNSSYCEYNSYYSRYLYDFFDCSKTFDVEGNIHSLRNSTNFASGATYVSENAFYCLFSNSKVVNAENLILPYTSLDKRCYANMFNNCSLLTKSPVLPAKTLYTYCYSGLFENCSSLEEIKCLATNISASGCTSSWVTGVAPTGTFIKDSSMTNWTTGVNGIPEGWTVEDAS